ncbi:zinc finger protein 658B-like [Engraulis encrasicolus]|uniref:zinc finger protein 658B-like n=1 Tax=Engraulis encrasicolus TaxID=184585 RepID=UPI002FD1EBE8
MISLIIMMNVFPGSSPATISNTPLPTLSDSPVLQAVLGSSQQSEKCLSTPHVPQSAQNKDDMYGVLNDEDCSGDADEGDLPQDWQVVIIGTSQHDQQCDQTCSADQGDPQRGSDEGPTDTSQHDQQSDSEQSSQLSNGLSSSYIVVDWRGDEDDEEGDSQRDSDEEQSDTSQHDQRLSSSSLMVDVNEGSRGDLYEGHPYEKQSHTIDQHRPFQQSSQMTFSSQQEEETTSGCINACERTAKIKTEEEDPPSIAVMSVLSDNQDISSFMLSKHDKVSLKADLVKNMNTRTKRNHVAAKMAADGPPHPCSTCGKAFSRKFDLRSHQTIHTGEKPHVCSYCGKRCRLKRMLKSHLKIHEAEWPFECSSCGKKFIQHTELEQHLKRHIGCRSNCERMTNNKNDGKDPPSAKEDNWVSSTQKDNLHKGGVLSDNKDDSTSLLIEHDKESLKADPAKNMYTRTKQNHVAAKMVADRPRHVCSICGKIFIRKSYLDNHHSIHTGEKPHVCSYCGKRFRLKDLLKNHLNTHKGEWPFECSSCGKKFIQHSELAHHLKLHTGCRSYCEMITNNKNEVKDQLSTKEENQVSSTAKDSLHKGVVLSDNKDVGTSSLIEHDKESLKADPAKSMDTHTKRNHVAAKMAANRPRHVCSICGKIFIRKSYLDNHHSIHTGEKPHVCSYCGKRFRLKLLLKSHMTTHKGEWPFECSSCGKKFIQQSELAHHLKLHTGCRSYCEMITNNKNEVKDPPSTKEENRMSSTAKDSLHKGVVLLDNKDVGTSSLIEHDKESLKADLAKNMDTRIEQNHLAAKMAANRPRHVCSICGKIFIRKSYLNNHRSIHTGEKPHVCSYCGKRFRLKDLLKSHLNTHKGEWPFECSSCGKKFIQHSELAHHLKLHTSCRSDCEMMTSKKNEGKDAPSTKEENRMSSTLKDSLHKGVVLSDNKDVGTSSLNEHDKESLKTDPAKNMDTRTTQNHLAAVMAVNRPCHPCAICGKTFRRKAYLTAHQTIHTGQKPHVCPCCGNTFRLRRMLKSHMTTHTGEWPFECSSCGKKFIQHLELAHHQKLHTGHMNTHTGELPFECSSCGKKFKMHSRLVWHLARYRNTDCRIDCERMVKNRSKEKDPQSTEDFQISTLQATLHKVAAHSKKKAAKMSPKYPCFKCEKVFSNATQLKNHSTIHTGERPHVCSYCGKTFRLKCILTEHLRTHTGERPYECSVCGKRFTQSSILAVHKLIHTGEKPYLCSICGKAYPTSGALSQHTNISHSEERPFRCEFCDKTFKRPYELAIHRRVHTKERPFPCTLCTKRFASPDHVKRHMRTHTGEKPYGCLQCGKRFAERGNLKIHQRVHR